MYLHFISERNHSKYSIYTETNNVLNSRARTHITWLMYLGKKYSLVTNLDTNLRIGAKWAYQLYLLVVFCHAWAYSHKRYTPTNEMNARAQGTVQAHRHTSCMSILCVCVYTHDPYLRWILTYACAQVTAQARALWRCLAVWCDLMSPPPFLS